VYDFANLYARSVIVAAAVPNDHHPSLCLIRGVLYNMVVFV